jgi:hypothetical protein
MGTTVSSEPAYEDDEVGGSAHSGDAVGEDSELGEDGNDVAAGALQLADGQVATERCTDGPA